MGSPDPRALLTLDGPEFTAHGEHGDALLWTTTTDDVDSLTHVAAPPEFGAPLTDLAGLRTYYEHVARISNIGLVEVDTRTLDGMPAALAIARVKPRPFSLRYVAMLSLPRRDCMYMLSITRDERTRTGVRETAATAEAMRDGTIARDGDSPAALVERGERRDYDARFPDHPLSRARRLVEQLVAAVRVADELRRMPAYTG